MIFFFLILNLMTFNTWASSGDGVGNGGLGFQCTNIFDGKKVTLTLDTAENLKALYPKNYFHHTDFNPKDLVNMILNSKKDYSYQIKTIAKTILDIKFLANLDLFTNKELARIRLAKKELLNEALFYIHFNEEPAPDNRTLDAGKVNLPSAEDLMYYGLKNCKIVQIAVYGYVDKGYVGKVLALRLHHSSLINMDDFNLKALLWHEVIYRALDDVNSQETRQYVSTLMKKL